MTITSYSELGEKFTASTVNWMARTFTQAKFDEFLDLAEGYFNINLRCREMMEVADLTPSSNVCTLPSDYLEYIRVVEKASIRRKLAYITADAADQVYPTRASGLSCHFMLVGDELTALPLSSNTIELTYYEKLPALSGSATSNWLLVKSPNLYLHGCMMYAAEYVRDADKLAQETGIVDTLIGQLNDMDSRSQFGNAGVTLPGTIW